MFCHMEFNTYTVSFYSLVLTLKLTLIIRQYKLIVDCNIRRGI